MALGLNLNTVLDFSADDDAASGHSNGHRSFNKVFPTGAAFARNKRKNFKPRNILPSEEDDHVDEEDDSRTISPSTVMTDGCGEGDECGSKQSSPGESTSDKWSQRRESLRSCIGSSVPGIKRALLKTNSGINCAARDDDQRPEEKHHHLVHDQQQQLPLDLSQSECRSSPPAAITGATAAIAAALPDPAPASLPAALTVTKATASQDSSGRTSVGFWRPNLVSGIAPWIDPSFLSETGTIFFLPALIYIFRPRSSLSPCQTKGEKESQKDFSEEYIRPG